jgi:hypothetical protein
VHFRGLGVVSTGVYLRAALLEVGCVCALNAAAVALVGIAVARRGIALTPHEA